MQGAANDAHYSASDAQRHLRTDISGEEHHHHRQKVTLHVATNKAQPPAMHLHLPFGLPATPQADQALEHELLPALIGPFHAATLLTSRQFRQARPYRVGAVLPRAAVFALSASFDPLFAPPVRVVATPDPNRAWQRPSAKAGEFSNVEKVIEEDKSEAEVIDDESSTDNRDALLLRELNRLIKTIAFTWPASRRYYIWAPFLNEVCGGDVDTRVLALARLPVLAVRCDSALWPTIERMVARHSSGVMHLPGKQARPENSTGKSGARGDLALPTFAVESYSPAASMSPSNDKDEEYNEDEDSSLLWADEDVEVDSSSRGASADAIRDMLAATLVSTRFAPVRPIAGRDAPDLERLREWACANVRSQLGIRGFGGNATALPLRVALRLETLCSDEAAVALFAASKADRAKAGKGENDVRLALARMYVAGDGDGDEGGNVRDAQQAAARFVPRLRFFRGVAVVGRAAVVRTRHGGVWLIRPSAVMDARAVATLDGERWVRRLGLLTTGEADTAFAKSLVATAGDGGYDAKVDDDAVDLDRSSSDLLRDVQDAVQRSVRWRQLCGALAAVLKLGGLLTAPAAVNWHSILIE